MGFLDELLTSLERVKRKFGFSWQKLLDQIPDQDRIDSYRFEETLNKWVLKSSMPEAEVPILDENRRLQVETPNFFDFNVFRISRKIFKYDIIKLDFLCDSITIMCSKITTQHGIIRIWYWDDINNEVIGDSIYYKTGDVDPFVEQVDTKPTNTFRVQIEYGDGVGAGSSNQVRLLFSKQKKTKISDTAYNESVFDGIINIGLSKNVFRDEYESHKSSATIHHTATIASDLLHNALSGLNLGDLQHLTDAQIGVLHTVVIASDLLHNELSGLNVGVNNKHLTDVQMSVLHNAVIASDLLHNELSGLNVGADNKHLTDVQMSVLHNAVIASDLLHNELSGLNAGTDYEHITQTQKDALHNIITDFYTQGEVDDLIPVASDFNHNDLDNLNAGTDYEHITQTQKDVLHSIYKSPIIYPIRMIGGGGFLDTISAYGAGVKVAFSDVNANVVSTFFVKDGGNFKIRIMHSGGGANNGKTAGGIYYINYSIKDEAENWDVGPIDFDIALNNASIIDWDDTVAQYTIANNSKVTCNWYKDNNAGGAVNDMYIYGILLVRQ